MTLTAETEVFRSGASEQAVVFFTANRISHPNISNAVKRVSSITSAVSELAADGWSTSIAAMFGDDSDACVYKSGFAHSVDITGVWEAPGINDAYAGIEYVENAGWQHLFDTRWMVGSREFMPIPSPRRRRGGERWAFFALWKWNDAWQEATNQQRLEYDAECDIAFSADLESGISIAGRHRIDMQSPWHHLGIWEVPKFANVASAMNKHEDVADFKFTISRHFVGHTTALKRYLEGI